VGPKIVLHGDADGWVSERGLEGNVPVGQLVSGLTLVLAPASELSGRVVDSDGLPVMGASVVVPPGQTENPVGSDSESLTLWSTAAPGQSTVTDANGEFILAAMTPGARTLNVTDGVHADWSGTVDPVKSPLEIVLEDGCTLSGWVLDERDHPIEGALVEVGGQGQRTATTDARGRFEVHGLPAPQRNPMEQFAGLQGAEDLLAWGTAPTSWSGCWSPRRAMRRRPKKALRSTPTSPTN